MGTDRLRLIYKFARENPDSVLVYASNDLSRDFFESNSIKGDRDYAARVTGEDSSEAKKVNNKKKKKKKKSKKLDKQDAGMEFAVLRDVFIVMGSRHMFCNSDAVNNDARKGLVKFLEDSDNDKDCPICLENIFEDENFKNETLTQCQRCFVFVCADCARKVRESKRECPVCRTPFI